jgi:hypothetical protein
VGEVARFLVSSFRLQLSTFRFYSPMRCLFVTFHFCLHFPCTTALPAVEEESERERERKKKKKKKKGEGTFPSTHAIVTMSLN